MAGAAQRTIALVLRVLQFLFSLVCMSIFSYFLAVLAHFNLHVLIKWRLVEAFTVLATIYTLFAIALVLCLAGSKIFGFIAIFFDILFIAAFIGVAWLTRHGASSCSGLVRTPVGDGQARSGTFGIVNFARLRPSLGHACIMNRVVFALAIILIFLFLATAILQLLMSRSKKDKRYASNEKDYNNTNRSSKTPIWKRNRHPESSSRSRSSSHRRSHRDRDHTHRDRDLAAAGVAAPVAARAVSGRRSGESGSTLDGDNYNREPKHHESGFDRPGHTPITARGHHNTTRDATYPDGTYRNDRNDPLHSVTVHSPTTTTTTTTHMPTNQPRTSSRGRRGAPGYAQEDANGNTHVPGFNTPLTQHTPYHEITTEEQREAALRNQQGGLGQTGYNQNMTAGQPGYGQREYHDTTRGQNILPGQGVNTIGNQREFDNRGQSGYDQNIVGNQRDYDNTNLGRRDITPGRDTMLGRDRDTTPGRVRDITPGRNSNRNTITNSRDYDNTNLGQTDYGRDNTNLGRRDITPGRDQTGYNTANQGDYDNRGTGFNPNTNQGYNDNYNRDSSFNRTPSAGRVRRF